MIGIVLNIYIKNSKRSLIFKILRQELRDREGNLDKRSLKKLKTTHLAKSPLMRNIFLLHKFSSKIG